MHIRSWLLGTFALFAVLTTSPLLARAPQAQGVQALDGVWVFVEDRTEGRPVDQQQPSTSRQVTLRVEKESLVLVRSDGEVRMAFDGSPTDVAREGRLSRYSGQWKDGAFTFEIELLNAAEKSRTGLIRMEMRPTAEGLLASVAVDPPTGMRSVALYRHPKDIAQPTPAKATIDDMKWLAGAWVGTRGAAGTTSLEERWSPPLGG
ncbi:MAG: hypothetical protein JNK15_24550, partial [Planctomycetes bacterium]|nr:hypothetical protein [Planctomycetota bacterium]